MSNPNLADILAQVLSGNESNTAKQMAAEGEAKGLAMLTERAKAFKDQEKDATFPFKMGQFVVPKENSSYALTLPSVVIDTNPAARAVFTGTQHESSFGNIPNLRVLSLHVDGTMTPIWVEAAQFTVYVPVAERS